MNSEAKKTILLVEDEAVIAITGKMQLEKKGYIVHPVSTGEKAVQTIIDNILPVDLILMDIDLGSGIDGTQAAAQILDHKDIPVVFLSSHSEPEVVEKTEKITSYGYVIKSSSIVVLDASIKMAFKLFDAKQHALESKEKAEESEARYRLIAKNTSYSIWAMDADFRFTYLSPSTEKLFGYSLIEWENLDWNNFVNPDYMETVLNAFGKLKSGKERKMNPLSVPVRHKNGNEMWVEFSADGLFDENEVFTGAVGISRDITERKQAEETLQQSEARLRSIIRNSPVGLYIYMLDSESRLVFQMFNPSADTIIRVSHEQFIGQDILEAFPALAGTGIPEMYIAVAKGELNTQNFEIPYDHRGIKGVYDVRVFQGEPGQVIVNFTDITERKRTEEALKTKNDEFESTNEELTAAMEEMEAANEELISANQSIQQADESLRKSEAIKNKMVSNISDVIVIIDENGINKYKSPNITKLFGWAPEELVGENTWNNIHPDDLEAGQRFFGTILTEPNAVGTTEMRYKRKDGNYVWIEISVINLLLDKDVQGILGNYHDITERKRAEDELRLSEARLRLAAESSGLGLWEWRVDLDKAIVSDYWLNIKGISREDYNQSVDQWVDGLHPEDKDRAVKLLDSHLKGETDSFKIEYRFMRPGIGYYWEQAVAKVIDRDADGKPLRMLGYHQEITDRKQAEQELKRQLTEKEILLREIHHRVKNNIGHIEGLLILQDEATNNPEAKSAIKSAIARVQSMRILYDKLLLSEDLHEISMKDYIEDLIYSLHDVFDQKESIIIEKQISNFSILSKQAVTIGIIINELLTNVYKYAFKDRDKGVVSISIEKSENKVTIIVQDNGIGTDEGILENKSPGFGLTIVEMLVEQLNGTYSIVNENGTKSVIHFEV